MEPPTREEVVARLQALLAGAAKREDVAEWAMSFVREDALPDDEITWKGLERLTSADAETEPSTYLYGQSDFQRWLADL